MKINRFLGICTALMLSVLCIGSAQADLNTGLVSYYTFENTTNVTDSLGFNNATGIGTTFTSTNGIIGNARNFTGAGLSYVNFSKNWTGNETMSVFFWTKTNNQTLMSPIGQLNNTLTKGWAFGLNQNTTGTSPNNISLTVTNSYITASGASGLTNNSYHFVGAVINVTSGFYTIYYDGVAILNTTGLTNIDTGGDGATFGKRYTTLSTHPYQGLLDEVGIWRRTLSQTEITQLYNGGLGLTYPFTNNLTISAIDFFNSTSINTFNATVNGTTYTTTTGTITTNINILGASGTVGINVTANNYHLFTNNSIPATSNFQARLQPYVGVRINDIYNSSAILSFNTSVNGTTYTTTNGVQYLPIFNSTYNITTVANNYFSNTTSIVLQPNNNSINISNIPYTAIRAQSYLGGSPGGILNFSINYTGYTNTSDTGSVSTTNGIAYIPLFNGSYDVRIFDAVNGSIAYGSSNVTLTANPYLQSYNFTLYLSNTINIVFIDEINLTRINWSTMQFYLTGELFSYNGSTNNGTANFSLIQPDNYIITYYSNMYTTRNYVYSLQNQSQITIYLYARPIANSTVVLITVNDQNTNAVSNATVYSRIKNLSSGDYYINEMCLTDNNGQCQITADVSTTTYKATTTYNFILYYRGVLVGSSGDTVLSGSTLNLRANVGSSQTTNYFQLMEVQFTNISFDNTTNTFSATVSDPYDNLATICLTTYRRTGSSTTQTNVSCNTGSTATPSVSTNTALGDENYAVLTGTYYNQTIIFDTSNGEVNNTAGTNYKAAYLIFVFLALIIVIFMGTKSLATTGMVFVAGIVIILAKVSSTILTTSILIGLIGMMVVIYLVMKVE